MSQTDKELAPIVAASAEGMVIECMHFSSSTWNIKEHVGWNPSAYTYRIIPPKPKMVKWYGWMDAGCAVRLMTTEFLTPPWKRLPHLDCELPE